MTDVSSKRAAIALGLSLLVATPAGIGAKIACLTEDCELLGNDDSDGGSAVSNEIIRAAENETAGVNTSNTSDVENATLDTRDIVAENLTDLRDAVAFAGNLSERVHAAHDEVYPNNTDWNGVRTNLTIARGPTGLGDAVDALHEEVGDPLTTLQEDKMRVNASEVPDGMATATAVVTFATIDAMHYLDDAFQDVEDENLSTVRGNGSVFRLLSRGLDTTLEDGNLTASFTDNETRVLRASDNVTQNMDREALYQAADVLAEALDEVRGMDITDINDATGTDDCANDKTHVYFDSLGCKVVIGTPSDGSFKEMAVSETTDENVVLVDQGGADRYRHRAGGGQPPGPKVQTHVDFGTGADTYDPTTGQKNVGAFLGSGQFQADQSKDDDAGAGLLFDAGGDDEYLRTSVPERSGNGDTNPTQGSANTGVGLFVDGGGDDVYKAEQSDTKFQVNAQGSGVRGLGLLVDHGGRDRYEQTLAPDQGSDYVDGGSSQGFGATEAGVGLLLDLGGSRDWYEGGQTYVQGAATVGGYGALIDRGGPNMFNLTASEGCPSIPDLTEMEDSSQASFCSEPLQMMANRSLGFADTRGFAGVIVGDAFDDDHDTYQVVDEASPPGPLVGEGLFGSGNLSGVGGFLDEKGNDTYEAYNASLGHGNAGLGAFIDNEGSDTYRCESQSCYGFGAPQNESITSIEDAGGLGVFVDGGDQDDTYAGDHPDDDGDGVWTGGSLGLGVNQSET